MVPHNIPLAVIGAAMLWIGWFGFNAGSALEANNTAALAFINTFLATACAVLSWTFVEWMTKGKPNWRAALMCRLNRCLCHSMSATVRWPKR